MTGYGIDTEITFELAIEASPSGVLVVDASGAILRVNREVERQFGYTRGELVGRSVDVLVPEHLRAAHATYREEFVREPVARPMGEGRELFGRRKDGTHFPVEIRLRPIRTPDGSFVLASIVDIGERRRLEVAERVAAEERLEFERFVAELSGQFINVPTAQIDETIGKGLGRIGDMLALDRSTFYKVGADGMLVESVSWTAAGVQLISGPVPAMKLFPWSLGRVLANEVVCFSDLGEIPNEVDRRGYRAADTTSAVVVPLCIDGSVAGAVEFDSVGRARTWAAGGLASAEGDRCRVRSGAGAAAPRRLAAAGRERS